ncbi:MAG: hypothetical protein LUH47_03830 [Clostridiales bacterium]|nr:hypothetical protein [Clostridiales bacterium]
MNETFNTTVQELKEIKNMIAELEDTIKQAMRESGKQEVFTPDYRRIWSRFI